jgi:D-alanyl-D-alanine carboxypeptidase (penicillin-binding protein 5/6)
VKQLKSKQLAFLVIASLLITTNIVFAKNGFEHSVSGEAAIVMDTATGRILFEKNIHQRLPMASTTKIMTALVALEQVPLDKIVVVDPAAVGVEGSSIYLRAMEEIKMQDLLYGLMLRSGNDAAMAIAIEAAGSVEDFAQLMNAKAKELGAYNTSFMNPHGLSHSQHYTTAYDLALITREAMQNPTFKEISKARHWRAQRSEDYNYFINKNKILSTVEGGDGVKTGFTKAAGRCLVASATRNDMQLIAVTLNDGNWFNTTKELLDKSFSIYSPHVVFRAGDLVGSLTVSNGQKDNVNIKAAKSIIIPVREEEADKIFTKIEIPESTKAPVIKGQALGKINTYLDGELIDSTKLRAEAGVERLTFKDKLLRLLRINIAVE